MYLKNNKEIFKNVAKNYPKMTYDWFWTVFGKKRETFSGNMIANFHQKCKRTLFLIQF